MTIIKRFGVRARISSSNKRSFRHHSKMSERTKKRKGDLTRSPILFV